MKKRGIPSPDLGDALALTFAERLAPVMVAAADYADPNSHVVLTDPLGGF